MEAVPLSGGPMTKDDWIQRELAKMPVRSAAWKTETLRLWGLRSVRPDDLQECRVETVAFTGTVDNDRADIAS